MDTTSSMNYYDTSTAMDPAAAAVLAGFMVVFSFAMFFLFALPMLIAMWKLFVKAGKPGWAAIVPFYNFYLMNEIGGGETWRFWVFVVACFVPFVGSAVAIVMELLIIIDFAKKFDKGVGFWLLLFFLPIVAVFMVKGVNFKGGSAPQAPAQPAAPAPTPTA